jgi:putative NADH-flavin reductase
VTRNNKELLVFGATGGTGQAIVREALERGYRVTAFVRDIAHAEQIFKDLQTRPTFAKGDAMNAEDVQQALEEDVGENVHAVISSLGIYHALPGHDELTEATGNIAAAMRDAGVKRFLCVTSLGVGESRGQGDFATRLIQKTGLRFTLADKEKQEALIRGSSLDWTFVRPTRLMDGSGPDQYLTWTGEAPDMTLQWSINRSDVAKLVIDSLEDDTSIGQAISVTGCSEAASGP